MQVGETAYWLSGGEIRSALIEKITVEVSNPANDGNGVQSNVYKLRGQADNVPESKIFRSKNALFYSLKGTWLVDFGENANLESATITGHWDFSYCKIQTGIFHNADFTGANFEGANIADVEFTNGNLTNASFRDADCTGVTFAGATITGADFRGAILTGCEMSANMDTKAEFKALVGAGKYDPVTTIWIDGNPIG